MDRIRQRYFLVVFRIVSQMMVFLILTCLLLSSCTSRRHLSGKDQKNVYLEKELSEANQRIEELYHRISVLQFMVDSHEKAIKDMESPGTGNNRRKVRASSHSPTPTNDFPSSGLDTLSETPENLYNQARKAYNEKRYPKAASLFSNLSNAYPHHDLADNAIYWQGESLYAQKKFNESILYFKKMMESYPESNKSPDALLKTGLAYLSLGDRKNAKTYLKKVTRLFPFSSAASIAAETLKKMN